ncbi:MAG: precorrin-6y C5,15-methyltransferase (decarboxylating) subunit CbiE [Deltaproteobacteria bacterium]|nr:precorrin-6y C5,15-methyltransferase (decarboxylating) subunit CbiE [Deltaproteobacteria bacterium]
MIYVIGIGISGRHSLTKDALKTINGAGLLVGGKRHLDEFPDFSGIKVPVGADLGVAAARIRMHLKNRRGKDAVILATGDPLLFGIADFIIKRFGKGRVEIIPNLSTVQAAFARIKESSNGLKVLSAHGRGVSMDELAAEILGNDRVAIFTDPRNTPSKIAAALLRRGVNDASVYVCEALGTSGERIRKGTLATFARARKFHPLNIMIIIKS